MQTYVCGKCDKLHETQADALACPGVLLKRTYTWDLEALFEKFVPVPIQDEFTQRHLGGFIEEQPGRESVVTDSEKAVDQMVQDIMSDKIDRTGRQAVRKALDQKDAPLVGRAKEDAALGNISRRGG
jgi:hypothetical protein